MSRLPNYALTWNLGRYDFGVYSYDTTFVDLPGIYFFGVRYVDGSIKVLYIGQASSLKERLGSHEKRDLCTMHQANVIGALHVPLQKNRDLYEADLIKSQRPILNTQLV